MLLLMAVTLVLKCMLKIYHIFPSLDLSQEALSPTPTSTPSTRTTTVPPPRPTYSGRKAKRGEALLDDQDFVNLKKRKIELELVILETQVKDISEKSALEQRLLAQQFEESAARTSYYKAATRAVHLKTGEPFDQSFNED